MQSLSRVNGVGETARSCLRVVRERDITYHAAALSYYTLISLIPLLTLLILVTTVLNKESVMVLVRELATTYLLPAGQDVVLEIVAQVPLTGQLTIISLALSLWGALRLFSGLKRSFTIIFEAEPTGLLTQVRLGALTLLTILLGILSAAALIGVIGLVHPPFVNLYGPTVLAFTLTVIFFPVYYFLPAVELSPRNVLPGTIFAALGWTALSTGFGFYVDTLGNSVTGAIGAFLLLLSWFYFAGLVLLFGGVLNAVLIGNE